MTSLSGNPIKTPTCRESQRINTNSNISIGLFSNLVGFLREDTNEKSGLLKPISVRLTFEGSVPLCTFTSEK